MSPFASKRLRDLFLEAAEIEDAAARAAFVQQACAGDALLQRRLEELLLAEQEVGPPPAQRPVSDPRPGEGVGSIVGRYKLLEQIGEGGCGVVYVAEQQEPVRRRVALKVIKLGMDTRSVVARFEAERQALALMDHPNIAKVLDAGATDFGRPYFVMELVGGIKITDYCEQNHLNTRQRLDLFIQVCRAVQHAHQKGVIHRDLKPSNVLVATQDGAAIPKVIDFGIAKATQGKLTDQTVFTAFEQFLGTPAYMSPEQAQVGGLDVDTRSDIYSLGVLLYELLTGKTPFDAKELLAAGLEAMRRAIQEKEPPTPSTRLKQETAARAATSDHSALCTLHSPLDKDLDWIVMKCLEKDRARRYETANGLAMDLQRHLNNEPVIAGPPSAAYRLGKFVRRNKGAVLAFAAVAILLVLGVVASTWQARQQSRLRQQAQTAQANEARERTKAQNEAAKSQQVAKFLKDMLQGVGPSVALGQDTAMLRGILDRTAKRIGTDLTNQPQAELDLRETLAKTYFELGLYKEMRDTIQGSLRLARASFGEESLEAASALSVLGLAQWGLGEFRKAEASEREALRIRRNSSVSDDLEVAAVLNNLALALEGQSKFTQAEEAYRRALVLQRKFSGDENAEVATMLFNLGNALAKADKLEDAVVEGRKALDLRRKLFGEVHPDVAMSLNSVATFLGKLGKLDEADKMFREVVEMQRKLLGKHRYTALALDNLACCLREEVKLEQAEERLRESLAMVRDLYGSEHLDVAMVLGDLAVVLRERGKLAEAEDVGAQTLAMNRKLLGDGHPQTYNTLSHLVATLKAEHKLAEAETLCQDQVLRLRAQPPEDDRQLADVLSQLTSVLVAEEKFKMAEAVAQEVLAIRSKYPKDSLTFNAQGLLAAALVGQQKYAEAEPLLISSYQGTKQREARMGANIKAETKEAIERLVRLYEAQGRSHQATEWKQQLEEFERAQTNRPPANPRLE